jgi:hypothetical protein
MKQTIYSVVTLQMIIHKNQSNELGTYYGKYEFRGKAFRELNRFILKQIMNRPFGPVNQ